jgi:putative hydrolase of the HAD superfamily
MTAVIFDLDDTLIVEAAHARASMARALSVVLEGPATEANVDTTIACARVHFRASPHYGRCKAIGLSSWECLWGTFAGCHASLDALAAWSVPYREAAWRDALAALGADPEAWSYSAERYVELQRAGHPAIPGALEAVVRASERGFRVGVLTNGVPDIQRLKLAQTGLEGTLDAVVVSGEIGTGKPDPAIFRHTLDALGAPAAETLMIGDSWERDVLGAVEVGIRPVWVAHGDDIPEARPDVEVVDAVSVDLIDQL